jgi:site-specific DNA-methyltransferase (adenine-specific)
MPNMLYFGDNLDWLPKIDSESVDLIYLDPPFNSQASYNLLYKSPDGGPAEAQFQAFEDSWKWGPAANLCYHRVLTSNSPATDILVALRDFMHESDMMAYLAMMTARLTEMHRVLKPPEVSICTVIPQLATILKSFLTVFLGHGPSETKLFGSGRMHTMMGNKAQNTLVA